jgi:hypothetical protein
MNWTGANTTDEISDNKDGEDVVNIKVNIPKKGSRTAPKAPVQHVEERQDIEVAEAPKRNRHREYTTYI